MKNLYVEPQHLAIIQSILAQYPYTFYAFGSRVKGTHRKFSDLDLCYIETIPSHQLSELIEIFEESDLPYKVDLVDFQNCAEDFKNSISKDLYLLQMGKMRM